MTVIAMHRTKPARVAGAGFAAYLVAVRLGLGPIAASAIRRKAKEDVSRGISAAMAVANARRTAIAMRKEEQPWNE